MFRTLLKRAAHLRVALTNDDAAGFGVTGFVAYGRVKKNENDVVVGTPVEWRLDPSAEMKKAVKAKSCTHDRKRRGRQIKAATV